MMSSAPLHGDHKPPPVSFSAALVVATASPSQSVRGLPAPLSSQPPTVAQPLVAVREDSPLPEGPPLAVLPPEDPLCQPAPSTSVVNLHPLAARSSK